MNFFKKVLFVSLLASTSQSCDSVTNSAKSAEARFGTKDEAKEVLLKTIKAGKTLAELSPEQQTLLENGHGHEYFELTPDQKANFDRIWAENNPTIEVKVVRESNTFDGMQFLRNGTSHSIRNDTIIARRDENGISIKNTQGNIHDTLPFNPTGQGRGVQRR